jgi:ribosomal protein L16 Arg81 hydroxylase
VIERLLGATSTVTFLQRFYLKFPYTSVGGAADLTSLGSWATVQEILNCSDADVLVVRQSRLVSSSAPPTYEAAREMHSSGCTIVIRNAQRQCAQLEQVAAGFRDDFCAPVDVHIYCTPAGQSGFGWHYDAEDVFIVQTVGRKEYSLRKNTVHPWPLVETIPRDMQFEREIMPLMRCTLEPGDWLYIPAGYWHRAAAIDASLESISLAIGVMATPAIEVLDFVRPRLLSSLLWRQRLPPAGQVACDSPVELANQYRQIFAQLAQDLANLLNDEDLLQAFLTRQSNSSRLTNCAHAVHELHNAGENRQADEPAQREM